MIRNLRKFGDEEKQLLLLKEQLQLAIANDEAISQSRQNFQKEIPPELTREDTRTLAEQIGDEDAQRVMAQGFLSEIFKNDQVLDILGNLSKDQIIGINTLWSGIKTELKGVNVKAMFPKDFISFLNKYMETAVSLQGALNVAINTVDELKRVIPTRQLMLEVNKVLDNKNAPDLVKQKSRQLALVLPTDENYAALDALPAVQKKQKIDELLNTDLPNTILLERAVQDESRGKIEKLLQSVTPTSLQITRNILDRLATVGAPPDLRTRAAPDTRLGRSLASGAMKANERKAITQFEDAISQVNEAIKATMPPATLAEVVRRIRDPTAPLSPRGASQYQALIDNNLKAIRQYLNDPSLPGGERDFIRRVLRNQTGYEDATTHVPDRYVFVGKGIKMGRGRPPSIHTAPKVPYKLKIGEGIKVKREPVNVEFGKYILNTNQLKKQVLHVKNRAGGALSWFQPMPMSDAFTELINDMLQSNAVNKHLLKTLDSDEQKVFYELCDRAGLLKEFKLVRPVDNEEKELEKKFQILLGEYQAGNNSPLLIQQLRKHVIYFANKGKIPKQKAYAMLTELS
jgi:hypothetical protein